MESRINNKEAIQFVYPDWRLSTNNENLVILVSSKLSEESVEEFKKLWKQHYKGDKQLVFDSVELNEDDYIVKLNN